MPLAFAQSPSRLLHKAYRRNSEKLLTQFFQKWHEEVEPVTLEELSGANDTIRQMYAVFETFYKPLDLDSLGGSEWGNEIYRNVDFLIVQNQITIHFLEKVVYTDAEIDSFVVDNINRRYASDSIRQFFLKRTDGKLSQSALHLFGPDNWLVSYPDFLFTDTILDFRPQIHCGNKAPVYLNDAYDALLNSFLNKNKYIPLGKGSIMRPAMAKGKSARRKKFLEKSVKIWYGHWGGYWQLYTYPVVYSITFDAEMLYAKVDFRMVYEGGEAILKRENNTWKLISANRTWIE